MKKLVRESIIEGVADKFTQQDPYLRAVPDEFSDFEKKYAQQQTKEYSNGQLFYKKGNLVIIKNPQDLKNFGPDIRGVILESGDLFLELKSEVIHNDILAVLKEKNLISQSIGKGWTRMLPEQTKFLTVQRVKNTNTLAIGESNRLIYDKNDYNKYISQYDEFLKKAKQKCKNIEFSNKIYGSRSVEIIKGDNFIEK